MTRFIDSTQLAELVNVAIGVGVLTLILICARLARKVRSPRLRKWTRAANRTRRGGVAEIAVAPTFLMDGIFAGDDDWPPK